MPPSKRKRKNRGKKQETSNEIEILDVIDVIDVIDDRSSSVPGTGEKLPGFDLVEEAGRELGRKARDWVDLFADKGKQDGSLSRVSIRALRVTVIRGLGVKTAQKLAKRGITDLETLASWIDTDTLARELGTSPEKFREWQLAANKLLKAGFTLEILPGLGVVHRSRLNAAGLQDPCQLLAFHPLELVKITGATKKTVLTWLRKAKNICSSDS